jgi:hypothetical protein
MVAKKKADPRFQVSGLRRNLGEKTTGLTPGT